MTRLTGWAVAALAAISTIPSFAWAQARGDYYGPHMWDGGWYGMFVGPLMMIVFIALAVAVIVPLVRWLVGSGRAGTATARPDKTAIDILRERYARGEIDKAEFDERRRVLEE